MDESRRLNAAIEKIQRQAGVNAPYGMRVNAEQEYAESYQELVRLKLKPQIREKYRRVR